MKIIAFFKRLSRFLLSEEIFNFDINFELAKEIASQTPFKVVVSTSENGGLKVFRKSLFLPSVYYVLIDEAPKGALISIRANKTERVISVVFSVLVCAVAGGGGGGLYFKSNSGRGY